MCDLGPVSHCRCLPWQYLCLLLHVCRYGLRINCCVLLYYKIDLRCYKKPDRKLSGFFYGYSNPLSHIYWTGGAFLKQRHSLLYSTLLLTLASMALRGVSIFFQVFLSGTIGAAGVGLLQLISTVSFFAMTIGTSGIRVGAMYLSAEEYGMRRPDVYKRQGLF